MLRMPAFRPLVLAATLCAGFLLAQPGPLHAQNDGIAALLSGQASEGEARAALQALNRQTPPPTPGQCMSPATATADQLIRLHTTLMLVSLACDELYGDPGLYNRYVDFTIRMEGLLTDALRTMEQELARRQGGNGFEAFNTYRTALANLEAQELDRMNPGLYCTANRSRWTSLTNASGDAFEAYAANVAGRAQVAAGC